MSAHERLRSAEQWRKSWMVSGPHNDHDPIELAQKYVKYYGGITLGLLILAKLMGWI